MIPKDKLNSIRHMQEDWIAGLERVDYDDLPALAALEVIAGALIASIPELLDEIARLQAATAEPERIRVFKMDRMGGSA